MIIFREAHVFFLITWTQEGGQERGRGRDGGEEDKREREKESRPLI